VKDALGGLQYELSPPDKQRHWFLVYAHYFPWCTSFWNAVSYAVLRPGAGPYSPVKVYADERTWYMGTDYPISLNVRADGFVLILSAPITSAQLCSPVFTPSISKCKAARSLEFLRWRTRLADFWMSGWR